VVNNNAAAVLLILNTLACGREVVVSRGELIEIEFRLRSRNPPILVRIENDHVLLDLRTVFPHQEQLLAAALIQAFA